MYRIFFIITLIITYLSANGIALYKKGEYNLALRKLKKKRNLLAKAYLAKTYFKLQKFNKSKKIIKKLLKNKNVPLNIKKELTTYLTYIKAIEKPYIYYNAILNINLDIYNNSDLQNSKIYLNTYGIFNVDYTKEDLHLNMKIAGKNFKDISHRIIESKKDYNQFNAYADIKYKYFGVFSKYQYLDYYNSSQKNYLTLTGLYAFYKLNNFNFKIGPVYEYSNINHFSRYEGLVAFYISFENLNFNIENYIANKYYKLKLLNIITLDNDKILMEYKYFNINDNSSELHDFDIQYLHRLYKHFGVNYEFSRKSYRKENRYLDYYIGFGIYFNFKGAK